MFKNRKENIMDRFNIRRLEGYTIMSNHHLRDQNLYIQLEDFYPLCYHYQKTGIIHLMD